MLYFANLIGGRYQATIAAHDGHVLLTNIPEAEQDNVRSLFADFRSGLEDAEKGVTKAAVSDYLEENGWTRDDAYRSPMTAFKMPALKAGDDFDNMTMPQLRQLATELGLNLPGNARRKAVLGAVQGHLAKVQEHADATDNSNA